MSSKQYREFARECLRWAEESASEEDRRHFLDMAKAWVHAAAELRDVSDHLETRSHVPLVRKRVTDRTVASSLSDRRVQEGDSASRRRQCATVLTGRSEPSMQFAQ